MLKKYFFILGLLFIALIPLSASASEVTMYAHDGRTVIVQDYEANAWESVGWYREPFIDMYSLDGRKIRVLQSSAPAYCNVGWYYEPVVKLYSADGRTIITELNKAYEYSKVGWYTLVDFMFENNFATIQNQFGPFQFNMYYPGTPNSGDMERTYYSTYQNNPLFLRTGITAGNYACTLDLNLADAFPYLKMYADENGYISVDDINSAFSDSGIYGAGYRSVEQDGAHCSFLPLTYYNYDYYKNIYGDFNCKGLVITSDAYGYVNINYATCMFDTLT